MKICDQEKLERTPDGKSWRCPECGGRTETDRPACNVVQPCGRPEVCGFIPRGIGDRIAGWLFRRGILKRPGCGCDGRQEKLNRFGRLIARAWRQITG